MSKNLDPFLIHLPREVLDHPFLVEASAGTGKTYLLTHLVFAYLLYKDISIDQILVITFTRNATAELKERLYTLAQEYAQDPSLPKEIRLKVQHLAAEFDRISILTINGFFQKIYQNTCLETGWNPRLSPTDDNSWLTEIACDYFQCYAKEIETERALSLGLRAFLALSKVGEFGNSPVKNLNDGIDWLTQNIMKTEFLSAGQILPDASYFERAWNDEEAFFTQTSPLYKAYHEFLHTREHWNGKKSIKLNKEIALSTASITDLLILFKKYTDAWTYIKKQEQDPVAVQLAELLKPLISDAEHQDIHLATMAAYFLRHFWDKTQHAIQQKIDTLNIMGMNHPNKVLYEILQNDPDSRIAKKLNPTYQVALIDEFQDTNAYQWFVLSRLFATKNQCTFGLIGDPKQLIYYFRGATPLTYSLAKEYIEEKHLYKMEENFRSHPWVLDAVNVWFSEIFDHYTAVNAGKDDVEYLIGPGFLDRKGMTFLESEKGSEPMGTTQAATLSYQLFTQQILMLLSDTQYQLCNPKTLSKRPITGSDIACLVQTKNQAHELKKHLDSAGIPCVLLLSKTSIFDSQEFTNILLLFKALAQPEDQKTLNTLLLSHLFSFSEEALLAKEDLSEFWEHFYQWQSMTKANKTAQMFDDIFAKYGYFTRIFDTQDSKRCFVNMRQIIALVIQEERASGGAIGPKYLYQRLMQIYEEHRYSDMARLHLEADHGAVRISNVHQAKGLEYPIVLGVFGVKTLDKKNKKFEVQDEQQTLIDMALSQHYGNKHLQKQFEESLRAFYVLVTRTKSHFFFPLLHTDPKPLAYLYVLACLLPGSTESQIIRQSNIFSAKITQEMITPLIENLRNFASDAQSPFGLKRITPEDTYPPIMDISEASTPTISCPTLAHTQGFHHRIPHVSSYSSLWQKKQALEEEDRMDEAVITPAIPEGLPISPLTLRGGADLGNLFHYLVENLDFMHARTQQEAFLKNPLITDLVHHATARFMRMEYHKNALFIKNIKLMLWNTLNTPLKELDDLCLCALEKAHKKHEIEFLLHIPHHTTLHTGLQEFAVENGFIRGFLDLVFIYKNRYYILDWKTTSLGYERENYSQKKLCDAMIEHGYDMQARLYLYALAKYLDRDFQEAHYDKIGGAIYLFSRASEPSGDYGVHFLRPSWQEVAKTFTHPK